MNLAKGEWILEIFEEIDGVGDEHPCVFTNHVPTTLISGLGPLLWSR